MIAAFVVELRALRPGKLLNSSGTAVHGAWFRQLGAFNSALVPGVHAAPSGSKPFTLSPLMGLPPAQEDGLHEFQAGQRAWLRICTLSAALSRHMPAWLDALPAELELSGTHWQVTARQTRADEHPWAGAVSYLELRERALARRPVPHVWTLEFATPTAIDGRNFLFPFPAPESLASSWMERWRTFSTLEDWPAFSKEELKSLVRERLAVESYNLRTVQVHLHNRPVPGCLGTVTFCAHDLPPEVCQALDALMDYAFFCGSGYKTTQGWGQTRLTDRK